MSELKLNLIDAERTLHGTIHGAIADAAIAALSAEPETIPELVAALARYIKPSDDSSPFHSGGVHRNDPRRIGQMSRARKLCSCWMCGNPRKYFNQPTLRERRLTQNF